MNIYSTIYTANANVSKIYLGNKPVSTVFLQNKMIFGEDTNIDTSTPIFEDITPSHTKWNTSGTVTDVVITENKLACTVSAVNKGLATDTLTDLKPIVEGRTLMLSGDVTTLDTTAFVKMHNGSSWSFGRMTNKDKLVDITVPTPLNDFKLSLENTVASQNYCEVNNLKLYLVHEPNINKPSDIPNRNFTIWSWKEEQVINYMDTLNFLKKYKVKKIYQWFSSALTFDDIRKFVRTLKTNNIEVEWLSGDPKWALTANHNSIIELIQRMAQYNSSTSSSLEKINSIQLDIEPHTLENWSTNKDEIILQYQQGVVASAEECAKHNLKIVFTLAHWYDGTMYDNAFGQGNLFDFTSDNSDGTAIMAYSPSNFLSFSSYEIDYCSKNNKTVAIGFETKAPGSNGVTEDITYYNRPVKEFYTDFEKLYLLHTIYNTQDKHEFAIHDYLAFKEYIVSLEEVIPSYEHLPGDQFTSFVLGSLSSSGADTTSSSSERSDFVRLNDNPKKSFICPGGLSYIRICYYDINQNFIGVNTGTFDNSSVATKNGDIINLEEPIGSCYIKYKGQGGVMNMTFDGALV